MVGGDATGRAASRTAGAAGSGWASRKRAKRQASVALPMPSRAADQPGVRQAAGPVGVEQFAPRPRAWPNSAVGLARMRRAVEPVALRRPRGRSALRRPPSGAAPRAREAAPCTAARSPRRRRRRSRSASITTQRSGSRAAMARKASRSASWKAALLALEPVGALAGARRARPRARGRSRRGTSRISVRSGTVGADDDPLERRDQRRIDAGRARPGRRGSNR